MRYVDKKSKKPLYNAACLKNWIRILGFIILRKNLKEVGFSFIKTRIINQDPLENFFGLIRTLGRRNVNPTCQNFIDSFKTLLINNLTSRYTIGGNCEVNNDCNGKLLVTLKKFIANLELKKSLDIEEMTNTDDNVNFDIDNETNRPTKIQNISESQFYTVGWLVKKFPPIQQLKIVIAVNQF